MLNFEDVIMELAKPEVIAVVVSLATVVAALWRLQVLNSKREQERLNKCEQMHRASQQQVIELTGEYRELKGRMDGVEKLSAAVLDKIRERRNE